MRVLIKESFMLCHYLVHKTQTVLLTTKLPKIFHYYYRSKNSKGHLQFFQFTLKANLDDFIKSLTDFNAKLLELFAIFYIIVSRIFQKNGFSALEYLSN